MRAFGYACLIMMFICFGLFMNAIAHPSVIGIIFNPISFVCWTYLFFDENRKHGGKKNGKKRR